MDDAPHPEVLAQLADELAQVLPGFRVIERGLTLRDGDRDVRAELAGLDDFGRLLLVVVASGDTSRALLDALALLAFAHGDGAAFKGARSAGETRVAIVCAHGADELARRASAVDAIDVFARETWSTESGAHARLVLRGAGAESEATSATFLARLGDDDRELAELCLARALRIGPGVEVRARADRIAWRRGGRELGLLAADRGSLAARAGRDGALRPLASELDVEAWLSDVLAEQLGMREPVDDLPPLPADDARPPAAGVLLTAEELAAFSG